MLEDLFQSQHFYDAAAGVNDAFWRNYKISTRSSGGYLQDFQYTITPDPVASTATFYERTGELIRDRKTWACIFTSLMMWPGMMPTINSQSITAVGSRLTI